MAGDAVAVLDACDVQKAHIIGISLGGMVAQEIAINYRDRVSSRPLIATIFASRPLMRFLSPLIFDTLESEDSARTE